MPEQENDIGFRPIGFCFPLKERSINRDMAVRFLRRLARAMEQGAVDGFRVSWRDSEELEIRVIPEVNLSSFDSLT